MACGLWSPHINGVAVPMWSPQYQTVVVVTIGLLAAMYDEERLHSEVAPLMVKLGKAVGDLLEGAPRATSSTIVSSASRSRWPCEITTSLSRRRD